MTRMLMTGPELGALLPEDVADHVLGAFAVYRLAEEPLRTVGVGALAARAVHSETAASALTSLRARIHEALAVSPDAVRVMTGDKEETRSTVLLGWGMVQVTTDNAGWYLVEAPDPDSHHTPGGLVAALPDSPAQLIERFTHGGCEAMGYGGGRTARYDISERRWIQVAKESKADFARRVERWLGSLPTTTSVSA